MMHYYVNRRVKYVLDACSNLAGTGVQLSCTKARAEKARYKRLWPVEWKMAFGG